VPLLNYKEFFRGFFSEVRFNISRRRRVSIISWVPSQPEVRIDLWIASHSMSNIYVCHVDEPERVLRRFLYSHDERAAWYSQQFGECRSVIARKPLTIAYFRPSPTFLTPRLPSTLGPPWSVLSPSPHLPALVHCPPCTFGVDIYILCLNEVYGGKFSNIFSNGFIFGRDYSWLRTSSCDRLQLL